MLDHFVLTLPLGDRRAGRRRHAICAGRVELIDPLPDSDQDRSLGERRFQ